MTVAYLQVTDRPSCGRDSWGYCCSSRY